MATVNLSGKGRFNVTFKPKNKKATLKRLLKYLLKHPIYLISAITLTICSSVLALFGPKLSGKIIDLLDTGQNNVVFDGQYGVWYYVLLMIIIYFVSAICALILNIIMVFYSQKVVKNMRKELFDHICLMPVSFFDKNSTGDIISRLSYDIDTVNTSLSSDIVTIADSVISIVGSFVIMLTIKPILVLVFVVTVPLSILYTKFMQKRIRKAVRMRSKTLGELNGYAEEMITGMKTVKAYSNEEDIARRFDEFNEIASKASCHAEKTMAWNFPGVNFITNLSLSLISIFSSILYMSAKMDLGSISSFVLYSRKFSGPINEVANLYAEIESAIAASERVFDIIDMPIEQDNEGSVDILSTKGEIEFKNVKFGYNPDKEIIHNLNLNVKKGQLVAIVGPTGAGKTTIINLLMRFYDYQDGKILLDGKEITNYTKKSLRRLYSMVLQDTWLRNGSIFENVRYSNKEATLLDVQRVCKDANIDDYITSLKDGYDTILNEGGSNISKGQKQLLTIARAMLLKSNILILDEATSNVDTNTEMKIQGAMLKLMENKTCFVIAHRLSTIQNADIILVINDGDIVEQGNHKQLIEKNGFYASLYNSQFE